MNIGMQHSKPLCGKPMAAAIFKKVHDILHEQCPKCKKYAHLYKATSTHRFWHCSCGHKFSTLREDKSLILPFGKRRFHPKVRKAQLGRGQKWCSGCENWLPLEDFANCIRNRLARKAPYCRKCTTDLARDYQARYYLVNKSRLAPGKRAAAIASIKRKKEQVRSETAHA